MLPYIAGRLGQTIVTLLGVSIVAFITPRLSGDPTELMLSQVNVTPQQRAELRHILGLDQPLPVQYAEYLGGILHGDFGTSLWQQQPVAALIAERIPATLELAAASLVLILAAGMPSGVLAAVKHGTAVDVGVVGIISLQQAMPAFWAGPLLIALFAVVLGWLPAAGRGSGPDELSHLVLPAATLAIASLGRVARITRAEMVDALSTDFVRTAVAKGLSRRDVVMRHALKVALIPVVTVVGLEAGALLGGAIITETIFAWPGVGRLLIQAMAQRDFPLIEGVILFVAAVYAVVNLVVDLSYTILDPRVRIYGS